MLLSVILIALQVSKARGRPVPDPFELDNQELSVRDDYRENYLSVSVTESEYKENYESVSIDRSVDTTTADTTTVSPSPAQLFPNAEPTVSPDTTGYVISALETAGNTNLQPFPTGPIPDPESLIVPLEPAKTPSSSDTGTETGSGGSAEPTTTSTTPMAQFTKAGAQSGAQSGASTNIFAAPIATNAPASMFTVRKDHPVPRLGVQGTGPYETNKFYANFYLGTQSAPTFTHPYSLAWAKGKGASSSWGMCVSHVEANQRVYGKASPSTGAASYFLNPIGIQSLCLSAAQLGATTNLTTDTLTASSANVNLLAQPGGKPLITFPLVQGMGFVTAVYKNGATPTISSGVFFKTVTRSTQAPKAGVTKYTFTLEDGKIWHLYGYSTSGDTLDLQVASNGLAKASKPFNGIIQIAKDPGNAEKTIDAAAGAYPTSVALSGTASGTKGSYTFTFQKAGIANTKLMMYALPHHIGSFDSTTHSAATKIQLQTTTKGIATAVVADLWTMVEPNMPVGMGFAPWDPASGSKTTINAADINTISPNALKEISQDIGSQSNQNSMYFSGKALNKFAQICYAVHDLLKNPNLAQSGLKNLKSAFALFASNKQQYPLYYETAWGGIVSSATYATGNSGADFGNTYYNDHHFHYGYFILTAAVIGYLDPTWLTKANVDYVNTLVRDVANPSTQDKYFPTNRMFDWYHGHSWAHGLFETYDGKDQESSSEDAMHSYAIKMWGHVTKDADMEARGNLMLAVTARSLNQYYLYQSNNNVQPSNFIGNKVAGILFENKCDHTTYFGTNIEYIQGIHMLPLIPSTKLTRPANFVNQEWNTFFSNGRANVESGWRGILYGNLATVDNKTAWTFFTQKNFDNSWLDGGASLTWYQAYTAAMKDS